MKFTKPLTIFLLLTFLTACGSTGKNISISDGATVVSMRSADYAAMKQAEFDALANAEYFKAEAKKYEHVIDPTAQVALRALDALDTNKRTPTNGNDVRIAEASASVQKTQAWTGLVKGTLGVLGQTALGYKGIDTFGKLATSALEKDSVNINADNGSTIQGAIGEGNTYSVEQVSGILTEPAPVNPITLGGGPEEGEPEMCDLRELIPVEEGSNQDANDCFDDNGDGLVCSTGGGCVDN